MTRPSAPVRILFLADSHLGFDLPTRPRVKRRRRGHDFLANYVLALEQARKGKVDLVIHGGDVFHRSKVPSSLVFQAFDPLVALAESGTPVFVVPGNHERSRIPHPRMAVHRNLHIFRRPETIVVQVKNQRLALSGFPYERRRIRERFPGVLEETGWRREAADIRLLCIHHCVEGATVGPSDFTFRGAKDVIRCANLPDSFAAVLSGHIHRHQVLSTDLEGQPLPTPVFYPGSLDRTAFAEMGEEKGFMVLEATGGGRGGHLVRREFIPLNTRPMLSVDVQPANEPGLPWSQRELESRIRHTLDTSPSDAVLRIRVLGRVSSQARTVISAESLRRITPAAMNLQVLVAEDRVGRSRGRPATRAGSKRSEPVQPDLWEAVPG